jgi:hypothetical protein
MIDMHRARVGFETPPGKIGLVYELLAEYGARIVHCHQRLFTLEFEEWSDARDFLRDLFGQRIRLKSDPGPR